MPEITDRDLAEQNLAEVLAATPVRLVPGMLVSSGGRDYAVIYADSGELKDREVGKITDVPLARVIVNAVCNIDRLIAERDAAVRALAEAQKEQPDA